MARNADFEIRYDIHSTKLIPSGYRSVLNQPGVMSLLKGPTEAACDRANDLFSLEREKLPGPHYTWDVVNRAYSAVGRVRVADVAGSIDNRAHNTLLKAVGGGSTGKKSKKKGGKKK